MFIYIYIINMYIHIYNIYIYIYIYNIYIYIYHHNGLMVTGALGLIHVLFQVAGIQEPKGAKAATES